MRKTKVKKILIIFLFVIICMIPIFSKSTEANNDQDYTIEEKAIREVANAYYTKGINIQYDGWRLSQLYSPEEATSQHAIYSTCTNYTYLIYNQAFGIDGGYINSNRMIAYANKYYDSNNIKTNDVVEYWKRIDNETTGEITYEDNQGNIKNIDLSTANARREYGAYLLNECNLQVGDIICYHGGVNGSNSGHGLIVYEIKYDENGKPIDAVIRESTSNYDTLTNKTTKGLCYMNYKNDNNNIYEGTHRELFLVNQYQTENNSSSKRSSLVKNLENKTYFTIIRPLLKNNDGNYTGNYYYPKFKYDSNQPTNYTCLGRELKSYEITNTAINRIKYSAIDIEKTVDVFNNSVVSLGDVLEYKIRITNNSSDKYDDFEITEQIPEYVDIIDSNNGTVEGNEIVWNISNMASGESNEVKYKVKVKEDISYLGKEIISTGTVAGIPSGTVKNTISINLSKKEQLSIKNSVQEIINNNNYINYSGEKLIKSIYNNNYGLNLNLDSFNITNLVKVSERADELEVNEETGKTVEKNYDINSYRDEDGDSLYMKPTVYLNNNDSFSKMVVPNYYGALRTNEYGSSKGKVFLRYWENLYSKTISRSERADSVYNDNFQTGDVLIYQNTQTPTGEKTYPAEDGIYYFIYIDESNRITIDNNEVYGFIGIDNDGNLKYVIDDYIELRSLLAKDYYVVLRPSMLRSNTKTLSLIPNEQSKLDASKTPQDSGEEIKWTSSNPEIVTVNQEGNVTAIKKGTATITASINNDIIDIWEVNVKHNILIIGDSKTYRPESNYTHDRVAMQFARLAYRGNYLNEEVLTSKYKVDTDSRISVISSDELTVLAMDNSSLKDKKDIGLFDEYISSKKYDIVIIEEEDTIIQNYASSEENKLKCREGIKWVKDLLVDFNGSIYFRSNWPDKNSDNYNELSKTMKNNITTISNEFGGTPIIETDAFKEALNQDIEVYLDKSNPNENGAYLSALVIYAKVFGEDPRNVSWGGFIDDEEISTKLQEIAYGSINQETLLGDVNKDGKINSKDAKMVLKAYTGKIVLEEDQQINADVNKDGKINSKDAKLILKYYTGKITSF